MINFVKKKYILTCIKLSAFSAVTPSTSNRLCSSVTTLTLFCSKCLTVSEDDVSADELLLIADAPLATADKPVYMQK